MKKEPDLLPDFLYEDAKCMFGGGLNRFLSFQFERVAMRLSGDLVWTVHVLDKEAAEIVRQQCQAVDDWTELKRIADKQLREIAEKEKQANLASAIKGIKK